MSDRDSEGSLNQYSSFIESCGGLDKIEFLQSHANQKIYNKAYGIIETYFRDDDQPEYDLSLSLSLPLPLPLPPREARTHRRSMGQAVQDGQFALQGAAPPNPGNINTASMTILMCSDYQF